MSLTLFFPLLVMILVMIFSIAGYETGEISIKLLKGFSMVWLNGIILRI